MTETMKETISTFFQRDHEEIDAILGRLRSALEAWAPGRPAAPLAGTYDEFNGRLERHIRWEEIVLFPAVEGKVPQLLDGPGRVMRLEHEEIRRFKGIAGKHLHAPSPTRDDVSRAREMLAHMTQTLVEHNRKEEAIYYPMSDQLFSEAEVADILGRVRAMP